MKKMTLGLFKLGALTLLTSGLAQAADATLTYSKVNAGRTPNSRVGFVCKISGNTVTRTTTGGFAGGTIRRGDIQWTNSVRSSSAIVDLIGRAAKGKLVTGPLRADTGQRKFLASLSSPKARYAQITLLLAGDENVTNTASAAKTLVTFLNYNCEQL